MSAEEKEKREDQLLNEEKESSEESEEDEDGLSRREILERLRAEKALDMSKGDYTIQTIPHQLWWMENLQMLSLSQNKLTDLPKAFGNTCFYATIRVVSNTHLQHA